MHNTLHVCIYLTLEDDIQNINNIYLWPGVLWVIYDFRLSDYVRILIMNTYACVKKLIAENIVEMIFPYHCFSQKWLLMVRYHHVFIYFPISNALLYTEDGSGREWGLETRSTWLIRNKPGLESKPLFQRSKSYAAFQLL